MSNALLGDVLRLQVTFHDWSVIDDEGGALVNPDSVTGSILDVDLVQIAVFTPIPVSLGVYYFDWAPDVVGEFYIEFTGQYATTSDVVRDHFTVVDSPLALLAPESIATLGETQYVSWMTDISPMYLDVEEILLVYPDISAVEISEFISIYSGEVKTLLKLEDGDPVPFDALEYIRAASLCSLSRLYDVNAGFDNTVSLGDLTIQQGGGGSSRQIGLSNASNWCELSYALRAMLMRRSALTGIKAIEKGINSLNPIPVRLLKSPDRGTIAQPGWPRA